MNTYSLKDRFIRLLKDEGGFWNFVLPGASLLGKLFSGGAKASAEGRAARDQAQLQRDQLNLQNLNAYERALQDRRRLEMDQRAMDAAARQEGFKGALRAAAIQQWKPANRPSGVPTISFVQKPQTDAIPEYERQMMLRLLEGEKFDALPAIERAKISPISQASTWEKIAGGLGLGLGVLGAFKSSDDDEDDYGQNWTA